MKLKYIFSLLINLAFVNSTHAFMLPDPIDSEPVAGAGTYKIHHPRCQSSNRCFYSTLPVYSQNDSALENYVGQKIGVANYSDQGMCVPTSAAMLIAAVLSERSSGTRLNQTFLQDFNSRQWYENVYQLGKAASTDFKNGGTKIFNMFNHIKNLFANIRPGKGIKYYKDGLFLGKADVTNSEMIGHIRKDKYAFLIGVDRNIRKEATVLFSKVVWYKRESGHGLVIKGYDGDRLHIQDPWGMDYFVRIEREFFKTTQVGIGNTHSVFKPITSSGWMGHYNSTHKLVLDELTGISLD
jgi:hypothetical protein